MSTIQFDVQFYEQKKLCLSRLDQSRKGSVDSQIAPIVEEINEHPDYVTTSSCSGRVILIGKKSPRSFDLVNNNETSVLRNGAADGPCSQPSNMRKAKEGCIWYWVSHDPISSVSELIKEVAQAAEKQQDESDMITVLKFEPFILHVLCRNNTSAKGLYQVSLESGFRNSGLVPGKPGKFMLAVRSTLCLELPIIRQGRALVSNDYLEELFSSINEKFAVNIACYKKFAGLFNSLTIDTG